MKNRIAFLLAFSLMAFAGAAGAVEGPGNNGDQFGDRFDDRIGNEGPGGPQGPGGNGVGNGPGGFENRGPAENPGNRGPDGGEPFFPQNPAPDPGPSFPDPTPAPNPPVFEQPGAFNPQPQNPQPSPEVAGGFNTGPEMRPVFEPTVNSGPINQSADQPSVAAASGSGSVMSRYITGDFNSPAAFGVDSATAGNSQQPLSGASAPGNGSSSSSFVFIVSGKVIAVDENKNFIVVQDKSSRQNKTVFVDPQTLSHIRKGSFIQTSVRPGSNRAENLKQIAV